MEKLNEMKNFEMNQETALTDYCEAEKRLAELIKDHVLGAEVENSTYGTGKVVELKNPYFENLIVVIDFNGVLKSFGLRGITVENKFTKFVDPDIVDIYNTFFDVHTEFKTRFQELDSLNQKLSAEAKQKAEADKKAEATYQKRKEQAFKEFQKLTTSKKSTSAMDDFYFNLGWLAHHVGTISAALPDYLLTSFESYFGKDANPRVIDSRKRTVNGFPSQWALSMKASLKGNLDFIPGALAQYLSTTGNAVANTSFVWDLVDNYGFQFGKQDIEKIREVIPTEYIVSFEEGLVA